MTNPQRISSSSHRPYALSRVVKAARVTRGFTLIELMVALSAGLFFSIFVFMLTRDVSRFFQQETRLADATMGTIIGFERLKADLARAGFLSSPNLTKDPGRCPRAPQAGGLGSTLGLDSGGWENHLPLRSMGVLAIGLGTGGSNLANANSSTFLTTNSLSPDRIRLYGNYQTAEQFPIRVVAQPTGGTVTVVLEPRSGAMIRLGFDPKADENAATAIIERAFPVGRAFRLVNAEGEEQYSIIRTVILQAGAEPDTLDPVITLDHAALNLQYKSSSATCGIRGFGAGFVGNVVNIIEYELDDTLHSTPQYQDLAPEVVDNEGETWARMDLVRFEVDPTANDPTNSVAIAGTREIVAEYAVDLRFGLTAVSSVLTGQVTHYPESSAEIGNFAGDPTQSPAIGIGAGPHLIRGIEPRLSVRTRAPDRNADLTSALTGVGEGLYRVALTGAGNSHARVRTLKTMVATRNTRNALW